MKNPCALFRGGHDWREIANKSVPFWSQYMRGPVGSGIWLNKEERVSLYVCAKCGIKRAMLSDPKWDRAIDKRMFPNGTRLVDVHIFEEKR